MKTLIPIAAALALAACNPNTNNEGIEPVPMDQDPTADQLDADGARGDRSLGADQQPGGLQDRDLQTDNPPFDQSESAEDVRLTAEIRRAVLDAEGMSTQADNVQIVTRQGTVRLSGTVQTDAEKQEIERIARGVAGVGNVENQIVVGEAGQQDGQLNQPVDEGDTLEPDEQEGVEPGGAGL